MARKIMFIAAIDDRNGLARRNRIPWDLPSDKKFFVESISSAAGLMGWKTFISNGRKPFKTCPRNFVLTSKTEKYEGVEIVSDLNKFIESFNEDLWIIGGGDVYKQLLPRATHLYLTRVAGDYGCDVFFPEFESSFDLFSESDLQKENGIEFRYQLWLPK